MCKDKKNNTAQEIRKGDFSLGSIDNSRLDTLLQDTSNQSSSDSQSNNSNESQISNKD